MRAKSSKQRCPALCMVAVHLHSQISAAVKSSSIIHLTSHNTTAFWFFFLPAQIHEKSWTKTFNLKHPFLRLPISQRVEMIAPTLFKLDFLKLHNVYKLELPKCMHKLFKNKLLKL